MTNEVSRRGFVAAAALGASVARAATQKPALLGGAPVRSKSFPSWPVFDATEERELLDVLRSGKWYRGYGKNVDRFEHAYAQLTGARRCIATANGTSALIASLHGIGVQPGDEVIVAPYTFVATINAVLAHHALPVFADTDPETFQIDPRSIEPLITERTVAILPVHLGGSAADLDAILEIGRKRKLPVLEDACQSVLGEWKNRKLGTWGAAGCFSFQASKNLNSGEGGAILTNDEELFERCHSYHNNGRSVKNPGDPAYRANGANLRMTEFQGALLMAQMKRIEEQSRLRTENGQYLTSLLREIPGIAPARTYPGCTRNAYHLYMFRYKPEQFGGLTRAKFLKALRAEGVPAGSGYRPLNQEPFLETTFASRGFRALYSSNRLNEWKERNRCPVNDRLCEEGAWLTQNLLLGGRSDMDQIAEAMRKIQAHARELARV
jgi:perosamine synthetase